MPLDGWDHVELWVGNAKQAAYFYEHAFGFRRTAYAGPETGVRDRCSYVLEQGEIRLVLTSGLRRDSRDLRVRPHARRRRQGHLAARPRCDERVPPGGAKGSARRHRAAQGEDEFGKVELAVDRDVWRRRPHVRQPHRLRGRVPSRLRRAPVGERERPGRRARARRPRRRQRRARPYAALGRVLRARLRDDGDDPLHRRGDLHRVLGADVEGDDGRRGQDQVPDQRARRGQAQEPDRGVPRVQPRPGRRSTSRWRRRTSSRPSMR